MKFLTLFFLASLAPLSLAVLKTQWEQLDEPQTSCAHYDFVVTDPSMFLDRQDCEEIGDLVDNGPGSWLLRSHDNGLEDWQGLTPLIAYGNCSVSVRRNDNRKDTFEVGSQDVRDFVDGALKNFANEFWVHLAYSDSKCETYRSTADLNFYLGPFPLDPEDPIHTSEPGDTKTTPDCETICPKCGHIFGQKEDRQKGCGHGKCCHQKSGQKKCGHKKCGQKECGLGKCGWNKSGLYKCGQKKCGHRNATEA